MNVLGVLTYCRNIWSSGWLFGLLVTSNSGRKMLVKNSWKLSINLFDLKISLQGMTRRQFNKHKLQSHRFQYNTDIRHEPSSQYLHGAQSFTQALFTPGFLDQGTSHCTRSPCVPDMPQSAQSGRRTSFGIQVWFIESYIDWLRMGSGPHGPDASRP